MAAMAMAEAEAMRGIGRESSDLTRLFFSPENREGLQQAIRYQVYLETGAVIGRQSEQELLVVMRRVVEEDVGPQPRSVTEAVKRYNEATLRAAAPDVVGAVQQHQRYMRELQTPVPVPLEHAVNMSARGTGGLEFPGLM